MFDVIPDQQTIDKTAASLKANHIDVILAENSSEAKMKALQLIPLGSEVMTMTSVTLDSIGLAKEINESGKYNSARQRLNAMDRATQLPAIQKLGAAPEYVIGSVHAVTEDGKVAIASNTGSQLPAYAYGSSKVIWVVGAQKLVKNLDMAFRRIYEHSLPLESERARKAYGVTASAVNKILIINNEVTPNRISIIIVKEVLGF